MVDARNYPGSRTVVVALEHHFVRVAGEIHTSLAFGYDYWRDYLASFDEVVVVARVGAANEIPADHFRADGPGVRFLPMPDYHGPLQFLTCLPQVFLAAWRAARVDGAFILRSGNIGSAVWLCLLLAGKPYVREIQGEMQTAIEEYTRGKYPRFGRALAALSEKVVHLQMRRASGASYVSRSCQARYPTRCPEREFLFSSVRLDEYISCPPRQVDDFPTDHLTIVSVGRLEREKGHHVLIQALRELHDRGVQFSATIVGPGSELGSLQQQCADLGISHAVTFTGPIKYGPRLFEQLDRGDLFVLPSLTEGMPRSLLEAMARGLPAIASRVGGVPELLNHDQMVAPNCPADLADAISRRIGNRELLSQESARNHEFAIEEFGFEKMTQRKREFWSTAWNAHAARRAA